MELLPVRTGRLFGWKFVLAALALASMVAIETAALAGCARHWFPAYEVSVGALLGTAGFQWFVTLPTVMLMLGIASACKNMWVSLGVGVILVFSLSIFPQEHPVLSLLPFSSPLSNPDRSHGPPPRSPLFGRLRGADRRAGALGAAVSKGREVSGMSFFSLVGIELKKIRRSKILLILLVPVLIMWIPSIVNAAMNFDTRGIPITPEHNFLIQGFMGMTWFMIPASLVICTVLLTQTERSGKGMLKMLSSRCAPGRCASPNLRCW